MPQDESKAYWEIKLRPYLSDLFVRLNKQYLGKRGKIVNGAAVMRLLNSTIGIRQSVVSFYGVALIIHERDLLIPDSWFSSEVQISNMYFPSIPTPSVLFGVNLKDFPQGSPLTSYCLYGRGNSNLWKFDAGEDWELDEFYLHGEQHFEKLLIALSKAIKK